MKFFTRVFIVLLSAYPAGAADMIYFHTGKSYECEIVSFSSNAFVVLLDGKEVLAPASNVREVRFDREGALGMPRQVPLNVAAAVPNQQKQTIRSFLAGKIFEEAKQSFKPDQLEENKFSIQETPIKLVFKRRSSIEQISETDYCTHVYDDGYNSIPVYFDESGLKYIRSIKESYDYDDLEKKYSLYGILLNSEKLEGLQARYRWWGSVFIPIGRSVTKTIGGNGVTYTW